MTVAAQERPAPVIDEGGRGQGGGRPRRVQHVPARRPLAAHETAAAAAATAVRLHARAEQQALAVAPVPAVDVQLVVPVHPDGGETRRGRDGRDQSDAGHRQLHGGGGSTVQFHSDNSDIYIGRLF